MFGGGEGVGVDCGNAGAAEGRYTVKTLTQKRSVTQAPKMCRRAR